MISGDSVVEVPSKSPWNTWWRKGNVGGFTILEALDLLL